MQVNPRRLYRSRDRQLAGVAGGMGEYLNIDPTVIRILWILTAIVSGGLAIIAYIVLAIVVPEDPWVAAGPAPTGQPGYGPAAYPGYAQAGTGAYGQPGYGQPGYGPTGPAAGAGTAGWTTPPASPGWSPDWAARSAAEARGARQARGRGIGAAAIVGVVLIVIGAIALADTALPGWSSAVLLGPAVIITIGVALLVASIRRQDETPATSAAPATPSAAPAGPAAPSADPAPGAPTEDPASTYEGSDTQPVEPPSFS
jgi:phage shock protein C